MQFTIKHFYNTIRVMSILSHVRGSVMNNDGFWIGFTDSYTFTQFTTTGNYSTIAILHTFQLTAAHAIGFSAFTSCILATDLSRELSLQITMKSFCHLLFSHLGMLTLLNLTQFSNANSPICS
jgi:hypothetical protein